MAQTTDPPAAPDVINGLAGIAPDSRLARLRAQRPEAVQHAQGSATALLEPEDPAGVSRRERELIALRVAILTPSAPLAARHRARLRDLGVDEAVLAAVEGGPDNPALSPREAAILGHTDRLTLAPGAAQAAHIAELKAAGLEPRDIVTIAQLIALLSFQVRVLAGLRLLAEEPK